MASTSITRCTMPGSVPGSPCTSITAGSRSMPSASAWMAGGKVAENSRFWRLAGQQREDAAELFGKAQVEQAVGLVEHQRRHGVELERVVLHQVEQAAGRGDHDVGAAAQAHHLRVDRHAAEGDDDLQALGQVLRQAAHGLADLGREFARGHEHQRAHAARPCAAFGARRCSSGRENAAVLPEPVCAEPRTSRPCRIAGMAAAWMAVGAA
jgi:hypothetical protein